MRRIYWLSALYLLISFQATAQDERENIHAAITGFFDGLSEVSVNKLRSYSTSDFLLLEQGEVWTLDTLVNKLSGRNRNIQRINSFKFIRTEQAGNIAWVSYHNTAQFSLDQKQQTVRWLESAVLRKERGNWKIELLHSTRINF